MREQRKEPRADAEGDVDIAYEDGPLADTIRGRLVDVSASGFRASHTGVPLPKGQVVRFRHGMGSGRARVVWNRITGTGTETGFVLDQPDARPQAIDFIEKYE